MPASVSAPCSANRSARSWLRQFAWAVAAVEGPFLIAMALAQVFVSCEHCRRVWLTHWLILPGLGLAELLHLARLPGLPDWGRYGVAGGLSLAAAGLVFSLARWSGHGPRVTWIAFAGFSLLAFLMHCLIRA